MVTLKIDTQERTKVPYIEAYLKATFGKYKIRDYVVERLATGDYAVGDLIGVERKSPHDFLTSVYSNLKQQLKELKDAYRYPYLFVEFNGIDEIIEHYKVSPGAITGAVASINSHCHVPIVFTSVYFSEILFKTVEKELDGKGADFEEAYSPIRRAVTKKEFKHNVIASTYHGLGISDVLAKRLLKEFKSPQAIFNATAKELMQVHGIGNIKAEKMVEIIKGEM